MNTKAKKKTIADAIDSVVEQLNSMSATTPEYGVAVTNLNILCEARSCKTSKSVSLETIVVAATNILGILLILNHERLNVISTKAVGLLMKGRV